MLAALRRRCAQASYSNLELYVEAARSATRGDLNLQEVFARDGNACAFEKQSAKALSQLRNLMLEKWGKVTCAPPDNLQRYRETLDGLRKLNGAPLRVFTTNYDLTFESLPGLSAEDGTLVNGFELRESRQDSVWSPTMYQCGMWKATPHLLVYRLHGCSHWFMRKDERIVFLQEPPMPKAGLVPMVVFPGRLKADAAFRRPFAFAYAAFREAIASAKLCVVIGCSLRDAGILDVLDSTPRDLGIVDTQFVVVDPTPDSSRIGAELQGWRRRHIQSCFGQANASRCLLSSCERFLGGKEDPQSEITVVPSGRCDDCSKCR